MFLAYDRSNQSHGDGKSAKRSGSVSAVPQETPQPVLNSTSQLFPPHTTACALLQAAVLPGAH